MMMKKRVYGYIFLFVSILFQGCVEPFEYTIEKDEHILVVEATISNELKTQKILLSRTVPQLDKSQPSPESNAQVKVVDDQQNEYLFQETTKGQYTSVDAFEAKNGRKYKLSIITSDKKQYFSEQVSLTQPADIEKLYIERGKNNDDVEGVFVFIDTYNPKGTSLFYKYEYEETYKVIAPFWSPQDVIIDRGNPAGVAIVSKTREEKTCYGTGFSNTITIASTKNLDEDRLTRFPVLFINRDNYIISHRYSILVKQYVQSKEAYQYFEILKTFSDQDNSFSQVQPGYLEGNIFSEDDDKEKVIGFFNVSSVTSKRVFFSYEDLFPGEPLPTYAVNCVPVAYPLPRTGIESLHNAIIAGDKLYIQEGGSYMMVSKECGDCNYLGNNVVPDFWEE